jgi:dUTP pyrophosphatase
MSTTHNGEEKFQVIRFNDDAKIPTRATSGSAGYDLYASKETIILAGNRGIVKTGIIVRIPKGYCGQVWPRSGFSAKNGIESGAGIIDSDYRGELNVILYNHSSDQFKVEKHMRMAQLLLVKISLPLVEDVFEDFNGPDNMNVEKNERGSGGFGSTGTK